MKVLLDMAISPNGIIAREDGDEDWLSSEGWDDFVAMAKQMNNVVMGRETYEQVIARYKDYNFNNVTCDYKVIVTHDNGFSALDGYLIVHGPEEAVALLESKRLDESFLIGGGKLRIYKTKTDKHYPADDQSLYY